MQKNRKGLVAILAVVLVAVIAIGGTLAYLTDSQVVKNKFNNGKLDVALEEPEWTDDPTIFPGDVLPKDPTVEAVDGDSYMRLVVNFRDTVSGDIITDDARIALIMKTIYFNPTSDLKKGDVGTKMSLADITASGWTTMNTAFTKDVTHESVANEQQFVYNYTDNSGKFEMGTLATLFNTIVIPTDWNQNQMDLLGKYTIEIKMQAVQFANFDTAAEAFAALQSELDADTALVDYKQVVLTSNLTPAGGETSEEGETSIDE